MPSSTSQSPDQVQKLQNWSQSILGSSSETFPSVPRIRLNDFSPNSREELLGWKQAREWERCASTLCGRRGTEHILKKCAGCSSIRGWYELYCSRCCQRASWPEHKSICDSKKATYCNSLVRKDIATITLVNCLRMGAKRTEALTQVLTWAFISVMQSHPSVSMLNSWLTVHFLSSTGQGSGTVVPVAFQLESLDDGFRDFLAQETQRYPGTSCGLVRMVVDGISLPPLSVAPLDPVVVSASLHSGAVIHWPWIVATVASRPCYNSSLTGHRLAHLLYVVKLLGENSDEIKSFLAPNSLDNSQKWFLHSFDTWQRVIGRVLGY